MATYFHYRDLSDIEADVERLGLSEDIQFEPEVHRLLEPVRIGKKVAWNSFGIHPMEGCDGSLDGRPGELTFRRYERFGSGGAALIWFEATAVVPEGRANPRQLLLTDKTASDIERLLRTARDAHRKHFDSDAGLVCGIQLTHSGRYSFQKPMIVFHDPVLDACKGLPADYPLVSDGYLEWLEDRYLEAAKLACEVGFDFVDIKQCHRYLLSELLAAKTRGGKYGGRFENRKRFVRNVVTRIRDDLGDKLMVASRINAYDGVPYENPKSEIPNPKSETRITHRASRITNHESRMTDHAVGVPCHFELPYLYGFGCDENDPLKEDLTEPLKLVAMLKELGVVMVNVSMGNPYTNPHIGRPFEKPPIDGYESPEHPLFGVARHFRVTRLIQQAFPSLVVVGSGYSWLRQFLVNAGEANKRNGFVSIVAVGRGGIAYPDYVKDVYQTGRLNVRKVCLSVSFCTALMRFKHNELGQYPCGCVPRDKVYVPIYREAERKLSRQMGRGRQGAKGAR